MNVITLQNESSTSMNIKASAARPAEAEETSSTPALPASIADMNRAIEERAARNRQRIRDFFQWLLPPMAGLMLFTDVGALVSYQRAGPPGPVPTWHASVALFRDSFSENCASTM